MSGRPLPAALRLVAAILAIAAVTDAAEETRKYQTDAGDYAIDLPAAWEVEQFGAKGMVLSFDVRVPGVDGKIKLGLQSVEGARFTPLAQAHHEVAGQKKQYKTDKVEVMARPLPHLVVETKDGVFVVAFVRQAGRGLHTFIECSAAAWRALGPRFLEAAATARTTRETWPPLGEGFRRSERSGIVYLTSRHVDKGDLRDIQSVVSDVARRFAKMHGKITRPEGERPVVYVREKKEDTAAVLKRSTTRDNYADLFGRRIFTMPFAQEGEAGHIDLVYNLWSLFFCEYYGSEAPRWAHRGECIVEWLRARTGKKLPVVTESWFQGLRLPRLNVDQLHTVMESNWEDYTKHGEAYVIFFRAGPAKYRKAYERFLHHIRETGDVKDAWRELLELDMETLRQDARDFLEKKLKVQAHR